MNSNGLPMYRLEVPVVVCGVTSTTKTYYFLGLAVETGKSGRQGQQNSTTSAFLSPGESCSSRHLTSELANIYPNHGTLHFLFDLTGGPDSPGHALRANGTGQEGEIPSAVRSFYCPQAWVPYQCLAQ
ncbi:hypothetical protein FALCPG4_005207 [Fusarium falciforme]